jgi:hypothetical protein
MKSFGKTPALFFENSMTGAGLPAVPPPPPQPETTPRQMKRQIHLVGVDNGNAGDFEILRWI